MIITEISVHLYIKGLPANFPPLFIYTNVFIKLMLRFCHKLSKDSGNNNFSGFCQSVSQPQCYFNRDLHLM